MQECVFCKIADNKIPSVNIYDSGRSLAFMDIMPARKGHVLVIPKKHGEILSDISEEDLKDIILTVRKVTDAMFKSLCCDGINVHQCNRAAAGQVVNHVHFHLIPRVEGDNLNFGWPHEAYDKGEMENIAGKIRSSL